MYKCINVCMSICMYVYMYMYPHPPPKTMTYITNNCVLYITAKFNIYRGNVFKPSGFSTHVARDGGLAINFVSLCVFFR